MYSSTTVRITSSCSPRTPPGFPAETSSQPTWSSSKVVESDTKEEIEKSKCVPSEQVQKIVNQEKIDFEKLLEAVRNDDFFCNKSENTAEDEEEDSYSNYEYENYPDDYWEMDDVTDEDVGEYNDNTVIL